MFKFPHFLIFQRKKVVWTFIIYSSSESEGPHIALDCYGDDTSSR